MTTQPQTQHTPGPLPTGLRAVFETRSDKEIGDYIASAAIHNAKGEYIGAVAIRPHTNAYAAELAQVWAAAPDLLAALEAVERCMGGPRIPSYMKDSYAKVRAAIAKARGQQ